MRSTTCTIEPSVRPVTLDEFKAHIRYSDNDYDDTLQTYLDASVAYCQEYQWAQYITGTFVDRFDRFDELACKGLGRNPVQSVTSIQYVDTGGTTQSLTVTTDYTVDIYQKPCRVAPAYAKYFPATRGYMNDVVVTYVAGYGDTGGSVPDEVRSAILLKAGQLFNECDATGSSADDAIKALLDKRSFRVFY